MQGEVNKKPVNTEIRYKELIFALFCRFNKSNKQRRGV